MHRFARTLVVLAVLFAPVGALAQDAATIAGTVRDASGAVLPGVTVEAASSALIEKVRSVATDGSGQYSIVALPPGTYSLTFTLPGLQHRAAGEHPADGRGHRQHQRRAPRRRPAGNGDGDRRVADRRYAQRAAPAGDRRRHPPDAAHVALVQRRAAARARRGGWQRPGPAAPRHAALHGARRQHAGRPADARRHQHRRVARRRRRVRLHPRHAERPGSDVQHLRQPRRGRDRRPADDGDPEVGRQHLQRHGALLRLQRQACRGTTTTRSS